MRRFASYVFCALVSTCFAAAVQAQDATGASVPTADKAFVTKAAQGGMAEVNLGKLAAEKASRPDVKEFGNMMVEDHTKANEQLKSVADQKSLPIPPDVGPKNQALYDRLSKLSGPAFDKAYVKAMVKDHREDVGEFKKEANSGKDPDIKNFASQTLPVLEKHLSAIEKIQKEGGNSAGDAKMSSQ
jgi:putative membrane protein